MTNVTKEVGVDNLIYLCHTGFLNLFRRQEGDEG